MTIVAFLATLFCRHRVVKLKTTGVALIAKDTVQFPGVQVTCVKCGELWHAELDASEAMRPWLV